jgi:hypothetical protein
LGPPFARGSHHRNITVTINGEEDFEGVTFENCNFESTAPPGERAVRFSDCTLTQCHFDELAAVEMQSESNATDCVFDSVACHDDSLVTKCRAREIQLRTGSIATDCEATSLDIFGGCEAVRCKATYLSTEGDDDGLGPTFEGGSFGAGVLRHASVSGTEFKNVTIAEGCEVDLIMADMVTLFSRFGDSPSVSEIRAREEALIVNVMNYLPEDGQSTTIGSEGAIITDGNSDLMSGFVYPERTTLWLGYCEHPKHEVRIRRSLALRDDDLFVDARNAEAWEFIRTDSDTEPLPEIVRTALAMHHNPHSVPPVS